MAHTPRTPARVQRLTSLAAMVAVAIAIAVAFGRVFAGGAVTSKLLVVGVATALVAWALERRSLFLATLAEVGLLLVLLGLIVFRDSTWHLLPGLDTLRAIGTAAGAVGEQARVQAAPAPPVLPLVFASVAAVWAAVFSCHALAFRAGSPMLALVPPAALIVFVDSVLEDEVRALYGIVFLLAALAVLFADSLRRMQGWGPVWNGPGRGDRLIPGAGRNARTVVSAVVAVAVLTPFLVPGFGGKATIDISDWGGDESVTLSALVSMASQLNQDEPHDVFEVQTDVPSYYRLTSLEDFDGVTWKPVEQFSDPVVADTTLTGSLGVQGEESTQIFTFVTDQTFPWLPTTYRPVKLEIPGGATWDVQSETVKIDEPLEAGESYTVHSTYAAPSPDDLEDVLLREGMDPILTELPRETPTTVHDIAVAWTKDAEGPYEKIMAIQEHLTSSEFVYDTNVAYHEDIGTIVDFLQVTKRGFCQQFATAMAVLLRSLGIPARVAVGFTEGTRIPNGGYRVQTDDYHAWVEVPFAGYGWLQFEPTKTQTNPIARTYNDPSPTPCRGRSCVDPSKGPGPDGVTPTPGIEIGPTDQPFLEDLAPGATQRRWLAGIAIALVLLATGSILLLALVRRRGRRRERDLAAVRPREAIVHAFGRFAGDAQAAGVGRVSGETPAEYLTRVAPQLEGTEPLDRLTTLTVAAAYGRDEPTTDDALDAIADADEASRAVRRSLPWYRRWRRAAVG